MSHNKAKQVSHEDAVHCFGMLNTCYHTNKLTGREAFTAGLKELLNTSKHYLLVYHFRPATESCPEQFGVQMFKGDHFDYPTNTSRREEVLNMDYVIMDGTDSVRVPCRSIVHLFPNVHLVDFDTWRARETQH